MIELFIMIAVVRAFARKAKEKGLNKTTWGVLGAASYYGPILLNTFLLLPLLYEGGVISYEGYVAMGLNVGLNLALGIACCFGLFQYLKRLRPANTTRSDFLDDFR